MEANEKVKKSFKEKWAYFKWCYLDLSKTEKVLWLFISYLATFILGVLAAYYIH